MSNPLPKSESASPMPKALQSLWKADWVTWILGAIAVLLVCGLALAVPMPEFVLQRLQLNRPVVPLLFLGMLWLSFRQRHRWEPILSLVLVLLLFTVPLILLWNTGQSNLGAIGGLIPLTDSSIYFRTAHGLLDKTSVGLGYARPFFLGLVTLIFGLTERSLMQTQVILTGITAIAMYLSTREVRRIHGAGLAAFYTIGIYTFYAPYIGSLMTENLGIALGVLGLAVLWRGAARLHAPTVLIGIFLLTMALCSRMGAVGVLPLLVVWGAYWFRRSPQNKQKAALPFSLSFIVQGFAAILLGFILNSVLARSLSSQDYVPFGNYSFVLYGLLTGGNWRSIFSDYPELFQNIGPTEGIRIGYQICLDFIRQNPLSLLWGTLRALRALLVEGSSLLVPPFLGQPSQSILINGVARPALVVALLACIRNCRRSPLAGLMLALILGTLASAPLAPVWDAKLRPYASTLMAYYAFLFLGLAIAWQWLRHWTLPLSQKLARTYSVIQPVEVSNDLPQKPPGQLARLGLSVPAIVGLVLCAAFLLGPLGMKAMAKSPPRTATCPATFKAAQIYVHPQSAIHLTTLDKASHTRLPAILINDFRRGLSRLYRQEGLAQALQTLKPGSTLLQSRKVGVVKMPTRLMPQRVGYYTVCGRYQQFQINEFVQGSFFEVQSLIGRGKPAS